MRTEQEILRTSIAATFLVAAFGVVFGLLSGSFSITFDGIYSLADGSMSVLALAVTRLIAAHTASSKTGGTLNDRFMLGVWHLEPLVLGLNATLLIGVSIYALLNAATSLLSGGRELAFDVAIVYAVVTLAACTTMAVLETRANRRIGSDFVRLDAKAWVMSGGITAALLIAFCLGALVQGTSLAWLAPYIDPAVLIVVCLAIIPLPVPAVRQALADVLLVSPEDLKAHVFDVAQATVERHGFIDYRAYVAKIGRSRHVEIFFIVPPGQPPRPLEDWDRIRDEVGEAIGGEGPNRWLTIVFTADIEWAV